MRTSFLIATFVMAVLAAVKAPPAAADPLGRRGPQTLASDLRHHHAGRLVSYFPTLVVINDDEHHIIGTASRANVARGILGARVVRVLKVDLVCVEVQTKWRARFPYVDDSGRHGRLRAPSKYLDFVFNEMGSISGLIFASRETTAGNC